MMVKEYHPDVIKVDVMPPDINGKEVQCQRVRMDSTLTIARSSASVAWSSSDKIQDLRDSGANDFMQKPFERSVWSNVHLQLLDVEPVARELLVQTRLWSPTVADTN